MDIYGEIKDGELYFPVTQSQYRQRWLTDQKDGAKIKESLCIARKPKSQEQLGAIFGLALRQIEMEFEENGWDSSYVMNLPKPTGVPVNKDMLKMYFYSLFPVLSEKGKPITLSGMDTAQAAAFFDNIRNFASSQWSIIIPEPDPSWKDKK